MRCTKMEKQKGNIEVHAKMWGEPGYKYSARLYSGKYIVLYRLAIIAGDQYFDSRSDENAR